MIIPSTPGSAKKFNIPKHLNNAGYTVDRKVLMSASNGGWQRWPRKSLCPSVTLAISTMDTSSLTKPNVANIFNTLIASFCQFALKSPMRRQD
jgi:hypothetical protein